MYGWAQMQGAIGETTFLKIYICHVYISVSDKSIDDMVCNVAYYVVIDHCST